MDTIIEFSSPKRRDQWELIPWTALWMRFPQRSVEVMRALRQAHPDTARQDMRTLFKAKILYT